MRTCKVCGAGWDPPPILADMLADGPLADVCTPCWLRAKAVADPTDGHVVDLDATRGVLVDAQGWYAPQWMPWPAPAAAVPQQTTGEVTA